MIYLDGTKNGKPLHHDINIMYPEIYAEEKTTIEIGMDHVRSADTIRISYDSDRDGWIIEQASQFEDINDPDWQEVAFIEAWAREKI